MLVFKLSETQKIDEINRKKNTNKKGDKTELKAKVDEIVKYLSSAKFDSDSI
jgi:hypothetical protein